MVKNCFMKIFVAIIFFFVLIVPVRAQDIVAKSEIDKSIISIGEQSNLNLKVNAPDDVTVDWPQVGDTIITEIEILSKGELKETKENGRTNYEQNLTITSFDSGYYAIPPFVFKATMPDGSVKTFETDAILYEVHTIEVDTTANIKAIKPIMSVPVTVREIATFTILSILVLALIIGMKLLNDYIERKRKIADGTTPVIVIAPNRKALDALYELEKEKLWQSGEVKEYYFRITSILREYIEGTFNIDAVEMVTEDIFEELEKTNKCEISTMTMANGIFVLSDLVKFAKYQPEMNENVDVMKNAYTFINESHKHAMEIKRKEEMQKEKQDEIGGQNV